MSAHSGILFDVTTKTPRAQALSVEDRQAMIIDAAIPLLLARGRSTTTRQIAEAAGIAEGTIFRAFADKETLIRAAIARYRDPAPLHADLRSIAPALPLDEKVRAILELLQARLRGIFGMYAVLGQHGEHPKPPVSAEFESIIARVLEPDLVRLNWEPHRVARAIRLVALASALPHLDGDIALTNGELADLILHGVVTVPGAPGDEDDEVTGSATSAPIRLTRNLR